MLIANLHTAELINNINDYIWIYWLNNVNNRKITVIIDLRNIQL